MANVKITGLTAITAPANTDVLPIVDVSADVTKKVSIADLLESAGDGTAALPAFAFDSDKDIGMYRVGANQLGFATAGTSRIVVDSSGNVGIGTTSPGHNLEVKGSFPDFAIVDSDTTNDKFRILHNGGATQLQVDPNNVSSGSHLLVTVDGSDAMRIDSSGRVLLGTTIEGEATADNLTIADSGNCGITLRSGTAAVGTIFFSDATAGADEYRGVIQYDHNGDYFKWITAGAERMRITSSGLVNVTGGIQVTENVTPTAGSGIEIFKPSSTVGQVQAYNRSGSAWMDLILKGNTQQFHANGSERMRIDSSGRLLVGASSARTIYSGGIQVESTSNANLNLIRNAGSASQAAAINISRSRGASVGSNTAVQSGDDLGFINFTGADGTDIGTEAAQIRCQVDGTPGSNDMPGRLVFSTTADGASSPTERMRIDSSGNMGIGTTSPSHQLTVHNASTTSGTIEANRFSARNNYGNVSGLGNGFVSPASNTLAFATNSTERMRIDSSGRVMIPTNTGGFSSLVGHTFFPNGKAMHVTTNDTIPMLINRQHNDGTLIQFRQADATEGSINVSGSTVSLSGAHLSRWSQLPNGAERIEILRGSVLSNLDEMCEWAYKAQDAVLYTEEDELSEGVSVGDVKQPARAAGVEDNEQLNRMKVSDVEGDRNVAGVFQAWDDEDDTYVNDFYCAMTGDFVIRIAQGTTVARGDLLMSAGDGTAKPQDDDIVRSKTIAKVTSTTVSTTYSDNSYCVPCVLMAC